MILEVPSFAGFGMSSNGDVSIKRLAGGCSPVMGKSGFFFGDTPNKNHTIAS